MGVPKSSYKGGWGKCPNFSYFVISYLATLFLQLLRSNWSLAVSVVGTVSTRYGY